MLRLAEKKDAGDLLAIYAPYITGSTVTFETEVPSEEDFAGRMDLRRYPWIVAEEDGRPVGYAGAHPYSGRAAYGWTVETSIYVRQDCRGKHTGRSLYAALFALLKLQGYCTAAAILADPNEPSERFHAANGFSLCGRMPQAGYKAGRWLGISTWVRSLQTAGAAPKPVRPVSELDPAAVAAALRGETDHG